MDLESNVVSGQHATVSLLLEEKEKRKREEKVAQRLEGGTGRRVMTNNFQKAFWQGQFKSLLYLFSFHFD